MKQGASGGGGHGDPRAKRSRTSRSPAAEASDRDPIEEAKSRLRLEEVDAEADACPACVEARRDTGDPTAYCQEHLARVYGAR